MKKSGCVFIFLSALLTISLLYLANVYSEPPKTQSDVAQDTVQVEPVYIPANLEECFAELGKLLPKDELKEFKDGEEDKAVSVAHFGLGMWMRNNWGLWSGSRLAKHFNEMGVFHPDDMSGIILRSFHRHLNNRELWLEQQVKRYQEYWEQQKKQNEQKERKQGD